MARLMNLFGRWRSLSLPWRAWRIVGCVGAADEIPAQLPSKGVILVGLPESAAWAAFDCPCIGEHRIMLNLDNSRYPFWSVTSKRPLTIRPSVDDIAMGRQCHFFIRRGRIRWASSDRRRFI